MINHNNIIQIKINKLTFYLNKNWIKKKFRLIFKCWISLLYLIFKNYFVIPTCHTSKEVFRETEYPNENPLLLIMIHL